VREWPDKARQLESAGKLITALKLHAEEESLQQWRARIRDLPRPRGPELDRPAS
jgi:hypothetical protein